MERFTARRTQAIWYVSLGLGLVFLGGQFAVSMAVGGLLMLLFGIVWFGYWSIRIGRLKGDPWKPDAELDAWEENEMRRK